MQCVSRTNKSPSSSWRATRGAHSSISWALMAAASKFDAELTRLLAQLIVYILYYFYFPTQQRQSHDIAGWWQRARLDLQPLHLHQQQRHAGLRNLLTATQLSSRRRREKCKSEGIEKVGREREEEEVEIFAEQVNKIYFILILFRFPSPPYWAFSFTSPSRVRPAAFSRTDDDWTL